MKIINVDVPKDVYDKLLTKFVTKKRIEDMFSLKLEAKIKKEIYLLKIRGEEEPTELLTICVSDTLYPYLNEYCIHRSLSKKEVLMKMIKKVLSR